MENNIKEKVLEWYKNDKKRPFVLSGYAGTGKTYNAKLIPKVLDIDKDTVQFLAPTGKASLVMGNGSITIHRFLYEVKVINQGTPQEKLVFTKKAKGSFKEYKLLIIDEISMVNDEMLEELKSTGVPIITLGDPFQLPPVNGGNTLLAKPDIFLTKVWRNDGGILDIATDIRMGNKIKDSYKNVNFLHYKKLAKAMHSKIEDRVILCKFNKTRKYMNDKYRLLHKLEGNLPIIGEKIIITQNNRKTGLVNGSIIIIKKILKNYDDKCVIKVSTECGITLMLSTKVFLNKDDFNHWKARIDDEDPRTIHMCDYAYCLTTHKSQGSEYEEVHIINEGKYFQDHSRWLYTAVTRAKEEVNIYE